MNNKVEVNRIESIFGNAVKDVQTVFGKCTIVACKLNNGFVIVESSACVDPANYNLELGVKMCEEKIKNKLWELEGYILQSVQERG